MQLPLRTTKPPRLALLAMAVVGVAWLDPRGACASEGSIRAAEATSDMSSVLKNKPSSTGHRDLPSTPIVLTFEGVGDLNPVGNFYNGGAGPYYGVRFGAAAFGVVDSDAGGTGDTANEPSPDTALLFPFFDDYYYDDEYDGTTQDATMTVFAGFTSMSFYYSSNNDAGIIVYDGPGGTGNELATVTFPATGLCYECGDPTGMFGHWVRFDVPFSGVAKSVRFFGVGFMDSTHFDDVTITPAPCTQRTYWLWDPTTNTEVRELLNNSASCIKVPYNIEVRPCTAPQKLPVYISLQNAATKVGIHTQAEYIPPLFLWGDTPFTGDVYANKMPLPKGTYYLNSNLDGKVEKIKFTQTC